MTLVHVIGLAIRGSIFLLVFAIGLDATIREVSYLVRRPALLARSLLSMSVVMFVFAIAVVLLFHLDPEVKIALVALAVSPVPPILPRRQAKAGGSHDYAIGLLAAAAAAAIIVVPVAILLAGRIFDRTVSVPTGKVALIVLITVLVPLLAGALVRRFFPEFATRAMRPISIVAMILLVTASLPVLFVAWKAMWALIGNGTLVCLALFTIAGLIAGHGLGGPDPDHRTVLALATGVRHPGVALAVAWTNFPDHKAAAAAIVLYLIVAILISTPYIRWRIRQHVASEAAAGGPAARPA
jgi:BASS family bile acid:Na+ symporter